MRRVASRVLALERRSGVVGPCRHGVAFCLDQEAYDAALAPCPRCGRPVGGVVVALVRLDGRWIGAAPHAGGG